MYFVNLRAQELTFDSMTEIVSGVLFISGKIESIRVYLYYIECGVKYKTFTVQAHGLTVYLTCFYVMESIIYPF